MTDMTIVPTPGGFVLTIPYKGFDISFTTVRHPEICVFPPEGSSQPVFIINDVTAEGLKDAFEYVDELTA